MKRILLACASFLVFASADGQTLLKQIPDDRQQNSSPYDVQSFGDRLAKKVNKNHLPIESPANDGTFEDVMANPKKLSVSNLKGNDKLIRNTTSKIEGKTNWDNLNISVRIPQQKGASIQDLVYATLPQLQLPIQDLQNELSIRKTNVDEFGINHVRMQQAYKGIPVYGRELMLHFNEKQQTCIVGGSILPSLKSINLSPETSVKKVEEIVASEFGDVVHHSNNSFNQIHNHFGAELMIYEHEGSIPALVYVVKYNPNPTKDLVVFVDAATGEIVNHFNKVCNFEHNDGHHHKGCSHKTTIENPILGPVQGQGRDLLGTTRTLQLYTSGGTYYMIDATRPMFDNNSTIPGKELGVLLVADANKQSPAGGNFQPKYATGNSSSWGTPNEVSAYYSLERSYEYFRSVHNRNSLDGNGGRIIAFVNVADQNGGNMDNAFYSNGQLYYGNGNQAFSDLAGGLDVGAHELTHGVVNFSADLEYQNESGALNEHFADFFAMMIDRDDWNVGEEVVKRSTFPSGTMRSFSDPHNGGSRLGDRGYQPKLYSERYTGSQDNGGVHINSGIPNYASYLIATQIGKEKTEKLYYNVLTNYLNRRSDFEDYRNGLQSAAASIYGQNSAELRAVVTAMNTVGMPGSGSTTGGTTPDQPQSQSTNPGTSLLAIMANDRKSIALVDYNNNTVIADITSKEYPSSKPSFSDDGSEGMVVTVNGDINHMRINYANNTVNESTISGDLDGDSKGDIRRIALSRDGNKIAFITKNNEPYIYIQDFKANETKRFQLYTPGSNGERILTVDFADVMQWDLGGEYLVFDAQNTITGNGGFKTTNWDIGVLHAFDGNSFASGQIQKLFGTLAEDVSVGNPSLSNNANHFMTFDYLKGSEFKTLAMNTSTNSIQTIFDNNAVGVPTYGAKDEYLFFNSKQNGNNALAYVQLASDKVSSADGKAYLFKENVNEAAAFANGNRVISSAFDPQNKQRGWFTGPNPTSDILNIYKYDDVKPEAASFELFDQQGRKILEQDYQLKQLDMSDLPKGTYILKLGNEAQKVIKL